MSHEWFDNLRTQYDELVPSDLVILDVGPHIRNTQIIMSAAWYEVAGRILVSYDCVGGITETNPLDAGIDLSKLLTINRIDDCLKRCNMQDGFYHA